MGCVSCPRIIMGSRRGQMKPLTVHVSRFSPKCSRGSQPVRHYLSLSLSLLLHEELERSFSGPRNELELISAASANQISGSGPERTSRVPSPPRSRASRTSCSTPTFSSALPCCLHISLAMHLCSINPFSLHRDDSALDDSASRPSSRRPSASGGPRSGAPTGLSMPTPLSEKPDPQIELARRMSETRQYLA